VSDVSISFSIIIPTYNRGHLIVDTIRSILDQNFPALEIIIIDDGSDDNTQTVISKQNDPRIKYRRTENRERGAARNAGLTIARNDYVNFFDSDDIFNPCLFQLEDFIVTKNRPPVLFGSIEIFQHGRSAADARERFGSFHDNLLHNNFLACGSIFIRRDIASHYRFSEDRRLSGAEDWELWLRLYAGHDFIDSGISIFQQREHPSRSLNQTNAEAAIERELAFVEHIIKEEPLLRRRFSVSEINLLIADRYTFIALTYIVDRQKRQAARFLRKSIHESLRITGRKRFWAVVKKIVLL